MKLSFRYNVWDNLNLYRGGRKVFAAGPAFAALRAIARCAADSVAIGEVVEISGLPALPISEESDRDALFELVYDRLPKGRTERLDLNVRPSRAKGGAS